MYRNSSKVEYQTLHPRTSGTVSHISGVLFGFIFGRGGWSENTWCCGFFCFCLNFFEIFLELLFQVFSIYIKIKVCSIWQGQKSRNLRPKALKDLGPFPIQRGEQCNKWPYLLHLQFPTQTKHCCSFNAYSVQSRNNFYFLQQSCKICFFSLLLLMTVQASWDRGKELSPLREADNNQPSWESLAEQLGSMKKHFTSQCVPNPHCLQLF